MPISKVVAAVKIGAATKKPTDPLRVPGDAKRNVPIISKAAASAIGIMNTLLIFRACFVFGFI